VTRHACAFISAEEFLCSFDRQNSCCEFVTLLFSNCKPWRIDHGDFKDNDFGDDGRPEIASEIANGTGNIDFLGTMTDSVEIPTNNLEL